MIQLVYFLICLFVFEVSCGFVSDPSHASLQTCPNLYSWWGGCSAWSLTHPEYWADASYPLQTFSGKKLLLAVNVVCWKHLGQAFFRQGRVPVLSLLLLFLGDDRQDLLCRRYYIKDKSGLDAKTSSKAVKYQNTDQELTDPNCSFNFKLIQRVPFITFGYKVPFITPG